MNQIFNNPGLDCIPIGFHDFDKSSDLKIISYKELVLVIDNFLQFIPVYILTDKIRNSFPINESSGYCFETMIRIGFSDKFFFLDEQVLSDNVLSAYHDNKLLFKKVCKHLYDQEILDKMKKVGFY